MDAASNSGLSSIFDDGWDVFTVEQFEEKTVASVLENDTAPRNAAHFSTEKGILKAAKTFLDSNGTELFRALDTLEKR